MGLCVAVVPSGGRSSRSPSDHEALIHFPSYTGKVPDDIAPGAAALLIFTLSSVSTSHSFAPGEDRRCHMQGGRGEVGEAEHETLPWGSALPSPLPPALHPQTSGKMRKGLPRLKKGQEVAGSCVSRAQKQPLQGAPAPTATQSEPALLEASPSLRDILRQSKDRL